MDEDRRVELIDKEIAGTLEPGEKEELEALQAEMLEHRRRVAPLPIEDTKKLRDELKRK